MRNDQNSPRLYARPDAGTDKTRWQPLDAHLRQVANLAAGLPPDSETSPLDAPESAENATRLYPFILGLLHDLGKAHPAFQTYLEKAAQAEADGTGEKHRAPINHSEAGAAWAVRTFGPFLGTLFAYVVAGHHAGLPDYLTDGAASLVQRLKGGKTTLEQLQKDAPERLAPFVAEIEKIAPLLAGDDSDELGRPVGLTQANLHFFVRFLFSRLVDADRLDSEAFADPETAANRGKFASIAELYAKFNAHMRRFDAQNLPPTDDANVQRLRQLRAKVLTACREKGRNDLQNRLYELTVPTGGGKTLSSLAFALERAQAAGLDRVVYVVPYTSIIEQTAAIFREIFGDANVVEHHSNFDAEETAAKNASKNGSKIDVETTPASEYALKARLAAENWDAPIIVTTNVQFFESLYSARGSRCRKLWRLERSVVVLDEAQTLPPRLLSPCVAALKALPELFATTLVLCTATQPTLSRLKELAPSNATDKTPELPPPTPIIENASELYATLARVRYVFDENLNPDPSWAENPAERWAQIANELEACGRIAGISATVSTSPTNPIAPTDSTDLASPTGSTAAEFAEIKKRLGLASADVADVLCVVNTRRDCYDLYQELKRRDAEAEARARDAETFDESTAPITIALSALTCGAHRAQVVEQIRERLEANRALPPERRRPLRVVSTQVIEAGVDVDFPVVFRALAGLDSIAQAAGRCNREGRQGLATDVDPRTHLPRGGLVRVFAPPKEAPEDLGRGQVATRAVLRNLATPFDGRDPETFETFFKEFYRLARTFDDGGFVVDLTSNVGELVDEDGDEYAFPDEAPSVPFRTVGENFRMIDDDYSLPVYVLYGDGAALIDPLETLGPTRELTRKLRRYSVNLPQNVVFELLKDGRVEELATLPGVYVQRDPLDYDAVFGYDVYNDGASGRFLEI